MEVIAYAAAIVVGLALGLFLGRVLNAVVINWESTAAAAKWSLTVIAFVLGGGAGAVIFQAFSETQQANFYLLGLGVGMLAAYRFAKAPRRYSLETFTHVVKMSEALRDSVPDVEERALLILTPFTPPKAIERDTGMKPSELADKLERATDTLEGDA